MVDKVRLGFGLLNYPFEHGSQFFKWVEMLESLSDDLMDELLKVLSLYELD